MSLRNDIYTSVSAALTRDLSDALTDLDCVSRSTSGYNPVTATATSTPDSYKLSGVLYNKKARHIDSTQSNDALRVKTGDMDLLVLVDDLNRIPEIDDQCTVTTAGRVNTGTTYVIVNYELDPTDSAMILHLRRHHG